MIRPAHAGIALLAVLPTAARQSRPIPIPVRYVEDRFVAAPVTQGGDTLLLFTDSGGGWDMVWTETVARVGLTPDSMATAGQNGRGTQLTKVLRMPTFRPDASIPLPNHPMFGDRFVVVSPDAVGLSFRPARDGFMGASWYADRIWVLDYLHHSLGMMPNGSPAAPRGPHQIPLTFEHDATGRRGTNFGRIEFAVDGDSIGALFDTGATFSLTPSARVALGAGTPSEIAGSFVAKSIFDKWHARHPDWRVIEHADSIGTRSMPMIEVPTLSLGGYAVGPAWFSARDDAVYERYRPWMDQPIHASVGGQVFRYFKIIADYPHSVATFSR